jgi:DNA polymerase III alpha subunit
MCDWDEGSLDVNHLHGNRNTDNSPDNLCYLCPNHHRMYSEGILTKEEIIPLRDHLRIPQSDDIIYARYVGKEFVSKEESYDIMVQGPHNNFVASDFVVHNSGMCDSFIKRRRGQEKEEVWHEDLRPYVKHTHGLPIYQEQIMFASQVLCGFNMAKADKLRKVIGKKKKEAIAEFRKEFVDSAVKLGKINEERANQIYSEIEFFGRYAFNLAHAAAYSVVSYYTGWLKTYYPAYFISALLNKFVAKDEASKKKIDDDVFVKYMLEAQTMGITIKPPDINTSYIDFRPGPNKTISYGLGCLKNIGNNIQELIDLREREGQFTSFKDFIVKAVELGLNKRTMISMLNARVISFNIPHEHLFKLFDGYQRPKVRGGGLSKTKKTILDDVRKIIRVREVVPANWEVMTEQEKEEYNQKRIEKFNDKLDIFFSDIPQSSYSGHHVIDPPGIYKINVKVNKND